MVKEEEKKRARKYTIFAFVCGIVSWLILALPLGFAGFALGIGAYKQGDRLGLAGAAFGLVSGWVSYFIGQALV